MDEKKSGTLRRCVIGFLIFLVSITYISRSIYKWSLPNVFLGFGGPETFTRTYEMAGNVRLTDEYPDYDVVSEFLMPEEDLPPLNRLNVYNGERVLLSVNSIAGAKIYGTIIKTELNEEGVYLTVGYGLVPIGASAEDAIELAGGEAISALYTNSLAYDFVVPSSAVHQNGPDAYLLTVHEEEGAFGREFVVSTLDVKVADVFYGKTAVILATVVTNEPIVINSDSPVTQGDKVRFYS